MYIKKDFNILTNVLISFYNLFFIIKKNLKQKTSTALKDKNMIIFL